MKTDLLKENRVVFSMAISYLLENGSIKVNTLEKEDWMKEWENINFFTEDMKREIFYCVKTMAKTPIPELLAIAGSEYFDMHCPDVLKKKVLKHHYDQHNLNLRILDAVGHLKDLLDRGYVSLNAYQNMDQYDYEEIAREFIDIYDCNFSENSQFTNIILAKVKEKEAQNG